MADFVAKKGDTHNALQATLYNPDGTKANLTGATVKFVMKSRGADRTVKVNADVTMVDATNGLVWYVWADSDVNAVGTYDAEFHVTYADGKKDTFPKPNYLEIIIYEGLI